LNRFSATLPWAGAAYHKDLGMTSNQKSTPNDSAGVLNHLFIKTYRRHEEPSRPEVFSAEVLNLILDSPNY